MKKSIEIEYWVIDQTGSLTEPESLTDMSALVEEEFVDCLFELKTPPCETITELRTTFIDQLDEVLSLAEKLDKRLVPLGTPINSESINLLDDERSEIQTAVLGSNFDYAKYCAGAHFHFEKRNVVDQLNTLLALDPALALCNSSPYFQGDRIADSARAYLYRKKCYEHFPKHGQLWEYADTVAQWERRLDRRFAEFKESATEKGIDPDRVDRHFSPDDVVWTPVRLRNEMPTVEWRSPDATLPSQLLQLIEDVDRIMEALHHTNVRISGQDGTVSANEIVLPEFDDLCDLAELAMEVGLGASSVKEYLARMGFTVESYTPLSGEFPDTGPISVSDARSLRLQYADRLVEDVNRMAARTPSS